MQAMERDAESMYSAEAAAIKKMRVKAIATELNRRGISVKNLIEKDEFVRALASERVRAWKAGLAASET